MLQSCQINMDHGTKNGFFSSWTGLTEHVVEKHLSKSTSTAKVHLNQQRQQVIVPDPDINREVKTQFVFAATIDAGQKYTDQTGRSPVV
jgi:hypothetical protein